jgi:hypothetical protein
VESQTRKTILQQTLFMLSTISKCYSNSPQQRANVALSTGLKKQYHFRFILFPFPSLSPPSDRAFLSLTSGSHPLASPSQAISPSISKTRVSHKPISPSISKNPYFHHSLSISQTHFFLGHFRNPTGTDLERRSRHRVVTGGALISTRGGERRSRLGNEGFLFLGLAR